MAGYAHISAIHALFGRNHEYINRQLLELSDAQLKVFERVIEQEAYQDPCRDVWVFREGVTISSMGDIYVPNEARGVSRARNETTEGFGEF